MGQCMFREKNIDNPPPYNEITASKITKAIDMDTINKHRAQKIKEYDDKYYIHLNKQIKNINKYIIGAAIPKNYNNIEYLLNFDSFKKDLGIESNNICQEYYKRLIDDMLEAHKQYKPVRLDNEKCELNLPNYKYQQKINITLW